MNEAEREQERAIPSMEREIAILARLLEALNRRRIYPLERSHYLLLQQLADGQRRIGELSTILALDATTVTRQVAAMEKRGLVARHPDPADRRGWLVEKTPEGAACAADMQRERKRRFARLLCEWDEADVSHFAGYLNRFNKALYDRLERPDEPFE